jgi:hypothetical protein
MSDAAQPRASNSRSQLPLISTLHGRVLPIDTSKTSIAVRSLGDLKRAPTGKHNMLSNPSSVSNGRSPPSTSGPVEGDVNMNPTHLQHQSPLFGNLSGELRTLIYEFALGHPNHLMHVILDRAGDQDRSADRRFRHQICEDEDTSYPTWQHTCFGQWGKDATGRAIIKDYRPAASNDGLLSLVLSCRQMYAKLTNDCFSKLTCADTTKRCQCCIPSTFSTSSASL